MPVKKRIGKLSRADMLQAVPVKNEAVSEENSPENGRVLVLPRKRTVTVKILSKVFFMPGEKKIALDAIGSWVWDGCDGETTVEELMEVFTDEFKVSSKEAEISLMGFLKKLSEKKLIGFMVKER